MNDSALSTFRFPANTCIASAEPQQQVAVTMESPGRDVMTDLSLVKAATVDPTTPLGSAEQIMIHQGVRLLFVVSEFPCVEGLITAGDLLGDKPMRALHDRGIRRKDLCVSDVMTELSSLDALDYADLKACNVGRVAATFRKFGRSHLLVVQAADRGSAARIRGVISLTQLERQLGRTIMATEIASTFAEIEKVLA